MRPGKLIHTLPGLSCLGCWPCLGGHTVAGVPRSRQQGGWPPWPGLRGGVNHMAIWPGGADLPGPAVWGLKAEYCVCEIQVQTPPHALLRM